MEVKAGEAGTVLAAVVLLLEHQRGLAEAIGARAVFPAVSGGGPPQPQEGHAALMFEVVGHCAPQ